MRVFACEGGVRGRGGVGEVYFAYLLRDYLADFWIAVSEGIDCYSGCEV
jgi:hypothetical protein